MIRRIFGNISEKQFKILYKTMIRPKLDYCSSIYSSSSNEDIEQLERVQKKMTKLIRGYRDKNYHERCLALKISSLKTRRIRGDLIEMFKIMTGIYNVNHEDYFMLRQIEMKRKTIDLRGHSLMLSKPSSKYNVLLKSCISRSINIWNDLPKDCITSKTLNNFKNNLDIYLTNKQLL